MSSLKTNTFAKAPFLFRALKGCFDKISKSLEKLAHDLHQAWVDGRNVYICGNGCSVQLDSYCQRPSLRHWRLWCRQKITDSEALSANSGVSLVSPMTPATTISSTSIEVKSQRGDLLIALSGSGNSPNIVKALTTANQIGGDICDSCV